TTINDKTSRLSTNLDSDFHATADTRYVDQITVDADTVQMIEYTNDQFSEVKSRTEVTTINDKTSRLSTNLDYDFHATADTRYVDQITVDADTVQMIEYTNDQFSEVKSRTEVTTINDKTSRLSTNLDSDFHATADTRYVDQITVDADTVQMIEYTNDQFSEVKSRTEVTTINDKTSRLSTNLDSDFHATADTRYVDQITVDADTVQMIEYTNDQFSEVKSRTEVTTINDKTSRLSTNLDSDFHATADTRYVDQITVDADTVQMIEYTNDQFSEVKSRTEVTTINDKTSRLSTNLDSDFHATADTRYVDQITVDSDTVQMIEYTNDQFSEVKSRTEVTTINDKTSRLSTNLDSDFHATADTRYVDQITVDADTVQMIEYTNDQFSEVKSRTEVTTINDKTSR